MSPVKHAVISVVAGAGVAAWTQSWVAGLACVVSGVLIDADHHLDYWLANKKFPWTYKQLQAFCCPQETGKMYLFLHAFEWQIILWSVIVLFQPGAIWLGIAVGMSVHLIFDQFTNHIQPWSYFIVFRAVNGFAREKIFSNQHLQLHNTHEKGHCFDCV